MAAGREHRRNAINQKPAPTEVPADHHSWAELRNQLNVVVRWMSEHHINVARVFLDESAQRPAQPGFCKAKPQKGHAVDSDFSTRNLTTAFDLVDALQIVVSTKVIVVISSYD